MAMARQISQSDPKASTNNVRRQSSQAHAGPEAPTPLEFDFFIPWVCRQLRMPEIIRVTRISSINVTEDNKKKSLDEIKTKTKTSEDGSKKDSAGLGRTKSRYAVTPVEATVPESKKSSDFKYDVYYDAIVVRTFYDAQNHLTEFIIRDCDNLPQKLISAIGLCLPFQPFLYKISFIKCKLGQEILYEVGKLFSFFRSKLTDIVIENTYVRELNYYCIVENATSLKVISLNGCNINDTALELLCRHVEGLPCLKVLELARNKITDTGVFLISNILRTNRTILHINLSGNHITDVGAINVLEKLMIFSLTPDEVHELRNKKMQHFRRQQEEYERSIEGMRLRMQLIGMSNFGSKDKQKKAPPPSPAAKPVRNVKGKKATSTKSDDKVTSKPASSGTFKPFKDVFDDAHITFRNGDYFCKGNLRVCSLNLANNYLGYSSIKKAYEVLLYQDSLLKCDEAFGLIRLVLDGANFHFECMEVESMKALLKKAVQARLVQGVQRKSFTRVREGISKKTVVKK